MTIAVSITHIFSMYSICKDYTYELLTPSYILTKIRILSRIVDELG